MTVAVRLDVPPVHRTRLAYAVETMLDGLGLAPAWTDAEPVLAIGLSPAAAPVRWTISPDALATFERRAAVTAASARWVETAHGSVPVPFGTCDEPDFASSAFFWLSGWQEWTTRTVDRHGRFPFAASLQQVLGVATCPVVDVYAEHLAAALRGAGVEVPGRSWGAHAWALCPTHDLDALRKWTVKSLWRGVRSPAMLAGALRHGDPYRASVEHLVEIARRRDQGATWFLKGGAAAPEDHAYSLDHTLLQALYEDDRFEIGLHPSYHAFDHPGQLETERARLAHRSGRLVQAIRHHYLRYTPATPALHDRLGFSVDSTLGFAEHEGFRRGTVRPFRVFDLQGDRPTSVWEMPLALMDTTLFGYRGLAEEDAARATESVLKAVRAFGGGAVALWHNDLPEGQPARAHYQHTLDEAENAGALITTLSRALAAWRAS